MTIKKSAEQKPACVDAALTVDVRATCPYCQFEDVDLFIQNDTREVWTLISEWIGNKDYSVDVECQECGKEFVVGGLEY